MGGRRVWQWRPAGADRMASGNCGMAAAGAELLVRSVQKPGQRSTQPAASPLALPQQRTQQAVSNRGHESRAACRRARSEARLAASSPSSTACDDWESRADDEVAG